MGSGAPGCLFIGNDVGVASSFVVLLTKVVKVGFGAGAVDKLGSHLAWFDGHRLFIDLELSLVVAVFEEHHAADETSGQKNDRNKHKNPNVVRLSARRPSLSTVGVTSEGLGFNLTWLL